MRNSNRIYTSILVIFLGLMFSGVGFGFTFTLINKSDFNLKILAGGNQGSYCLSYNGLPHLNPVGSNSDTTRLLQVVAENIGCMSEKRFINFNVIAFTGSGPLTVGKIFLGVIPVFDRAKIGAVLHYPKIYPVSGAGVTYNMKLTGGTNFNGQPGTTTGAVVTFVNNK